VSAVTARARRGALAILLHTHMPYVEGFGTWPFGEEWLWEAMASSYLPLLELLDEGAPLTLSLTPVLCDQLAAPGIEARFADFIENVRRSTHAEDAAGLREAGEEHLALELERSWRDYERALESLRRRGGDLLGGIARHGAWTSSATHAVLPMLASDAAVQLQIETGVESHRSRCGEPWRGGFWLPECGYAPWLEGSLERAGVRAVCVELTARLGLGASEHLRPIASDSGLLLVPIDRVTMSLIWSDAGYPAAGVYRDYHHHTVHHHNPWNNAGEPYDNAAALLLAREHARDFVARASERLEHAAEDTGHDGLIVCALDTELLGHWWYEGVAWLRAVVEECERQGVALVGLDDALADSEPVADRTQGEYDVAAQAESSWGSGGDLSTWSGPAVAQMAFAARAAELQVLAAGRIAGATALRELLALQASDWAFMSSRGIASSYAEQRFDSHLRALKQALSDGPEADGSALRNLAPAVRGGSLLDV
jgi:1,4-alpha-glucan branching enzyme